MSKLPLKDGDGLWAKGGPPKKGTMHKKERIAYSKPLVTMQRGEMKSVTMMMMGENQSC
jgi:hypothetical protein